MTKYDEEEQKDADTSGVSAVDDEGVSSTRSRKPLESNDKKPHDAQPSGTYPPSLLKHATISSLKSAAVLFLTTAIPAASMVSAATNDSSMCKSLHHNINISSSIISSRACYHNFSITCATHQQLVLQPAKLQMTPRLLAPSAAAASE